MIICDTTKLKANRHSEITSGEFFESIVNGLRRAYAGAAAIFAIMA